jgi:LIM homeobox transcription factor 1
MKIALISVSFSQARKRPIRTHFLFPKSIIIALNNKIAIMSVAVYSTEPSVSVKTESGLLETICANCGRTIADKYVMRVAERNYHEDCLSCTACGTMLSHSCFIRDFKLYCRSDYEKIFGVKCARCMVKISCSDLVMRPVSGLVFHVECFACCMCGQPLPRGAHYILRQGQPICRRDFEHELFLNSPQGECIVC